MVMGLEGPKAACGSAEWKTTRTIDETERVRSQVCRSIRSDQIVAWVKERMFMCFNNVVIIITTTTRTTTIM